MPSLKRYPLTNCKSEPSRGKQWVTKLFSVLTFKFFCHKVSISLCMIEAVQVAREEGEIIVVFVQAFYASFC